MSKEKRCDTCGYWKGYCESIGLCGSYPNGDRVMWKPKKPICKTCGGTKFKTKNENHKSYPCPDCQEPKQPTDEEKINYAKYDLADTLTGDCVTKDGHKMFIEDIVKDLNRKSCLEKLTSDTVANIVMMQQENVPNSEILHETIIKLDKGDPKCQI